ncbi:MAG: SBBP repeat-containing protein [Saprospiraceae bacterium]|nr:SBBP repeat-containing protein [Saprospiraceae bacterium]
MQRNLLAIFSFFICLTNGIAQSINPQVLWATYFGSSGDDLTGQVVTDKEDNIYMTSTVKSGAPTTAGVHQTTYGGGVSDVMLSKFDKNGNLIWSTYFGGSGNDMTFFPISIMSDGAIVITGTTSSSNGIATVGSHDQIFGGSLDAFLAVFEDDGKLRWATYFGGTGFDAEPTASLDLDDNIYLAGYTTSPSGIATDGTFQSTKSGNEDGFLAKFDMSGKLIWSTYFGGQEQDFFTNVSVDRENNVYVAGAASSSNLATVGSFQENYEGNSDGFLAKFSKDGKRLWATYIGSDGTDGIFSFSIDHHNDIICIGSSNSKGGMASPGAYEENNSGKNDIFISKFNANGQQLWSTFFGGEENENSFGCDVDKDNNIYISALTQSKSFPVTEDVPGNIYNGGTWDAAFVKFSPEGDLKWSTYFGGNGNDRAFGITLDSEQNIVASINSTSKGLATPGAYNEAARGNESLLIKMKDATIVNTKELEKWPALSVFPNPTTSHIQIPNPNLDKRNITIYNAMGEMQRRYLFITETDFDLYSLPNGPYYITVENNGITSVVKVLKVE